MQNYLPFFSNLNYKNFRNFLFLLPKWKTHQEEVGMVEVLRYII